MMLVLPLLLFIIIFVSVRGWTLFAALETQLRFSFFWTSLSFRGLSTTPVRLLLGALNARTTSSPLGRPVLDVFRWTSSHHHTT